jgi:hypothetical protein
MGSELLSGKQHNNGCARGLEKGGLLRQTRCPPLLRLHMQGGPASLVKVLLSENQPLTAIDGAPKNHEKNTSSCKWYP